MWIKEGELKEFQHDQQWLDDYKKLFKRDYIAEALYLKEATVIGPTPIDFCFSNVEAIYSELYTDGVTVREVDSLDTLSKLINLGYKRLPVYGVMDYKEGITATLENLFKYYPELKAISTIKNESFALSFRVATEDFRFHKNGGYRGEDEVGEHVYESPKDKYLLFKVSRLTK